MNLTNGEHLIIVFNNDLIYVDLSLFPEYKLINDIVNTIIKEKQLNKEDISWFLLNNKPNLINYVRK